MFNQNASAPRGTAVERVSAQASQYLEPVAIDNTPAETRYQDQALPRPPNSANHDRDTVADEDEDEEAVMDPNHVD